MVTCLISSTPGNSTLLSAQGNPNDRLSRPHCRSSRTVSLRSPIQLRQGLHVKTQSRPQSSLGLSRPRAVGIMVYGTRQAILHQMHQIWPQCGSLFPREPLFLSCQQQDKRRPHHLPSIQPLCMPQRLQVQVRPRVPQM